MSVVGWLRVLVWALRLYMVVGVLVVCFGVVCVVGECVAVWQSVCVCVQLWSAVALVVVCVAWLVVLLGRLLVGGCLGVWYCGWLYG